MAKGRKRRPLGWQWWLFGSVFISVGAAWAALLGHVQGQFLTKFALMVLWGAIAMPLDRMSLHPTKGYRLVRALELVLPAAALFLIGLVLVYGNEGLYHAAYDAVREPGRNASEGHTLFLSACGAQLVFWIAWPPA